MANVLRAAWFAFASFFIYQYIYGLTYMYVNWNCKKVKIAVTAAVVLAPDRSSAARFGQACRRRYVVKKASVKRWPIVDAKSVLRIKQSPRLRRHFPSTAANTFCVQPNNRNEETIYQAPCKVPLVGADRSSIVQNMTRRRGSPTFSS